MKLQPLLHIGIITGATIAATCPAIAQPIPPKASSACIQQTAEAMVVPAREIDVIRAGPIDAENGVRTLFMRNRQTGQTAECRVNTIFGNVLSVTLTSQPNRPTVSQALINSCIQRTAEEMVVPARNIEVTSIGPISAESGAATLVMRDRTTGQTAECRVNTATNAVLSVQITSPSRPPGTTGGRPLSPNDPTARQCQAEVSRRVRTAFAGVQTINFLSDTTRAYFVSNAQESIRGKGLFFQRSGSQHQFNYDCLVNIRNGRVTSSTFNLIR